MTPASVRPGPPKASIVRFKAALRRAVRKNRREPEIDFLNITALLDLITIILVFLLQSMATSATTVAESQDLVLPKSIMTDEPAQEGVRLTISKSAILIGDSGTPVVTLPSRESLTQSGLDARLKRSGQPNDLYIVPLANALQDVREFDKRLRAARQLDPATSEAIIVADSETPYRLLIEVLYTLGQCEFGKYHLLVKTSEGG